MSEIPDDWIPLVESDADSTNPDGGVFIDPTGSQLHLIRYNDHRENDVIPLWDTEAPALIHRLVDYQAGELDDE